MLGIFEFIVFYICGRLRALLVLFVCLCNGPFHSVRFIFCFGLSGIPCMLPGGWNRMEIIIPSNLIAK